MKVLWIHNNKDRNVGMFMWDIFDSLRSDSAIALRECSVPVVTSARDMWLGWRRGHVAAGSDELVHAQYGSFVGLVGSLVGGRFVLSLRGSDTYTPRGKGSQRLGGWIRVAMSYIAACRADRIIVMSHAMAAAVRRWPGVSGAKIHVLPDPAGESFWRLKLPFGLPDIRGTQLRVVVGSLQGDTPVKRLHLVREAVALCAAAGLNVQLTAVAGLTRSKMQEAIDMADVVAVSSTHEGWPNIVKEAILLGKPFIATDVSDLAKYALRWTENHIVNPTPVDFAFAMIDRLTAKALDLRDDGRSPPTFYPQACAYKHKIIYLSTDIGR